MMKKCSVVGCETTALPGCLFPLYSQNDLFLLKLYQNELIKKARKIAKLYSCLERTFLDLVLILPEDLHFPHSGFANDVIIARGARFIDGTI